MSREARMARLASFWGCFMLLVSLRVLWMFVRELGNEVDATTWISLDLLRARIGWLRPLLLRSPFLDAYFVLFLGLAGAACLALWIAGLSRWWRAHRAAQSGGG